METGNDDESRERRQEPGTTMEIEDDDEIQIDYRSSDRRLALIKTMAWRDVDGLDR